MFALLLGTEINRGGAHGSLKRPREVVSAPAVPPATVVPQASAPRGGVRASAALAAVAVASVPAPLSSLPPAAAAAAAVTSTGAAVPPQPDSEVPCMRGEMALDAATGTTTIKGKWAIRAADFADPKATSNFEYTLAAAADAYSSNTPVNDAGSGSGGGPISGLYSGWFAMKMLGRSSRKVPEDNLQLQFTPRPLPAADAFDLRATGSNSFGSFVMHGSAVRSSSSSSGYAVEIFRNYTAYNEAPALMPKTARGWAVAAEPSLATTPSSSSMGAPPPQRPLQRQASAAAEKEPRGGPPPPAPSSTSTPKLPKALQTPKYFANAVASLGDSGRKRKAPNKLSAEHELQRQQQYEQQQHGGVGGGSVGLEAAVKTKLEKLLQHLKGKSDAVYFLEPVINAS